MNITAPTLNTPTSGPMPPANLGAITVANDKGVSGLTWAPNPAARLVSSRHRSNPGGPTGVRSIPPGTVKASGLEHVDSGMPSAAANSL